MKKILIVAGIIILLTGCTQENKKNNSNTSNISSDDFKKHTECTIYNSSLDINDDENGMTEQYFSLDIYYDTLDDENTYIYYYTDLEFNSWQNAKTYYEKLKDDEDFKKFTIELSEEDIDTYNTGTITMTHINYEPNSPRTVIEEEKANGFECETEDNK